MLISYAGRVAQNAVCAQVPYVYERATYQYSLFEPIQVSFIVTKHIRPRLVGQLSRTRSSLFLDWKEYNLNLILLKILTRR